MHNIKLIKKDPETFVKKLSHRNTNIEIKSVLDLDKKNRELIQAKEKLEHQKKSISKQRDQSQFSKSKDISNEISKLTDIQADLKIKSIL